MVGRRGAVPTPAWGQGHSIFQRPGRKTPNRSSGQRSVVNTWPSPAPICWGSHWLNPTRVPRSREPTMPLAEVSFQAQKGKEHLAWWALVSGCGSQPEYAGKSKDHPEQRKDMGPGCGLIPMGA